ncbi:hypothetical protein IC229_29010 [Spirosoma sp. BT702]|uniref:Uncharacterized protein n=1 Tax=Spirosoma profusum TaxID=2771354 RepID=A0A927GA21_9BACT|nr:hypothetical protein [Spirosoma profusum]
MIFSDLWFSELAYNNTLGEAKKLGVHFQLSCDKGAVSAAVFWLVRRLWSTRESPQLGAHKKRIWHVAPTREMPRSGK